MFSAKKQDMPPPGGYEKIVYERNPGRVLFKGRHIFGAYLAITAYSIWTFKKTSAEIFRDRQERQGGLNAAFPFLLAERDRAYLKRIYENREREKELMKNVEGWEVGTYYGEPIYKTVDVDKEWVDPIFEDYYVNVPIGDWMYRGMQHHYW